MTLSTEFLQLQEVLLGRYSLERELGRGGMGVVYLARDIRLDRPVALKVLQAGPGASPVARARFLEEARTAARLSHPHIVPVFAVETQGPFAFFVMEYLDGGTLGGLIRRRGPLRPDEAERVLREVAWALGYAHAHGVIHRDLTLENILIDAESGRALLADFGLAQAGAQEAGTRRFGTPGFLAPEVIRGEAATPASDLYALGVVTYTALTGRPPHEGATTEQLLAKHLLQPVPSLAGRVPGAARRLCAAVEQCLLRDPRARPADSGALLALLERPPEPVTMAPALQDWFGRWRRIAPVYSAATPLMALGTWMLAFNYYRNGSGSGLLLAIILAAGSLTVLPALAHALFEIGALRRLQRRGFGIADLRAAWPHWIEEQQEARQREGLRPLANRVIFDVTAVVGVMTFVALFLVDPVLLSLTHSGSALWFWLVNLSGAGTTLYLLTMIGVGVGFSSPGYRIPLKGRIRGMLRRFWNTPFAARLARIAGTRQSREAATATLHRPTAMVLGLAIEDLWRALTPAMRYELGDVPALAQSLQRAAGEWRTLIDRLRDSETDLAGDAAMTELVSTRIAIEEKHRETVATLERLRLQLLRLLATRQTTSDLTGQIDAARQLEEGMLRDIAAHETVHRILGEARTRRAMSPVTPLTPVAA